MDIAEKTLQLKQDFDDVYEAGKKAEYDAFWDSINTNNVGLAYGFAGSVWNDVTFKPKNDIILIGNSMGLFNQNECTNIKQRLQEQNVNLNLSKVTNLGQGFYYSKTTELPEIDLSNCNIFGQLFANAKVKTIDKVTFKDGIAFSQVFQNCTTLEEIRIGGTIGQNGFDIHWSTNLSAESIDSIVRALSPNTTGLTVTLPAGAYFTHATTYGAPNTAELWESKSNWTINELAV